MSLVGSTFAGGYDDPAAPRKRENSSSATLHSMHITYWNPESTLLVDLSFEIRYTTKLSSKQVVIKENSNRFVKPKTKSTNNNLWINQQKKLKLLKVWIKIFSSWKPHCHHPHKGLSFFLQQTSPMLKYSKRSKERLALRRRRGRWNSRRVWRSCNCKYESEGMVLFTRKNKLIK